MTNPSSERLLERLAKLPAGGLLLERVGGDQRVYLVGGAVRDLLLGGRPAELDLVVDGDAPAVARQLGGTVEVHDRFGTSTVRLDGHRYDIARARRETYPRPGALPDVEPASLAEDLERRDFTINAIALDLQGGELESVSSAFGDLQALRLRVLHDQSFIDDPTRLLRLIRYASRLGFEVEPGTRALARSAVQGGALATVSGARLGAELRLLAREADPVAALKALAPLELDRAIHPGFGMRQVGLARRALALLPTDGRSDLLTLAAAGRELPAEELAELLDTLAFEAHDRDVIVAAATRADHVAAALTAAARPSEIATAAAGAGAELVALAGAIGADQAATSWLDRLRQVKLEIDGNDLIAAGVPRGPQIGRGLAAALAAKLDGVASDRTAELEVALQAAAAG